MRFKKSPFSPGIICYRGLFYFQISRKRHSFWADWLPENLGELFQRILLRLRDTLPGFLFDLGVGIISGIPICCNIYYSRRIHEGYPETWKGYNKEETPMWLAYIPCPYCLARERWAHQEEDVVIPGSTSIIDIMRIENTSSQQGGGV